VDLILVQKYLVEEMKIGSRQAQSLNNNKKYPKVRIKMVDTLV